MSNVIQIPVRPGRAAEGTRGGDDRIGAIVESAQRLAQQKLGRPLSSEFALKLAQRIAAAPLIRS